MWDGKKVLKLEDVISRPMKEVIAKPPMWTEIIKVFPSVVFKDGILFCVGNEIYNPSRVTIPPYLLAHEAVHSARQEHVTPGLWWQRYLEDKEFRLTEELNAHRVEYEAITVSDARIPRQQRRAAIHRIAERLSGPLYGKLISKAEARKLIEAPLGEA